jgi:phage FluMu protein Com
VGDVRCANCNRLVAKRTAPGGGFEVKCRGCSALVLA